MEYKSKYTASEIDARLSQVFDSTLQTKEVEVSEDTTIKADEGFLGLKEVSVKVSGGGGLEGEYYLDKPNNYWKVAYDMPESIKYTDPSYLAYSAFTTYFGLFGAVYEAISYNGCRMNLKMAIGHLYEHCTRTSSDISVRQPIIAARDGKIDMQGVEGFEGFGVFNSLMDLLKMGAEMEGTSVTEDEIISMLAEQGIQRITKEEYESLITA